MLISMIISAILAISVFLNVFLYLIVKASLNREKRCVEHILDCQESFESCLRSMREIDRLQMFEKDDDVGVVFQKLKEVMEKTDEKIKNNKSL